MTTKNFQVKNGLTVGQATISASDGAITTSGPISTTGAIAAGSLTVTNGVFYANGVPFIGGGGGNITVVGGGYDNASAAAYLSGNITVGNIQATGFYFANGAPFISGSSNTYGNTQVQQYLSSGAAVVINTASSIFTACSIAAPLGAFGGGATTITGAINTSGSVTAANVITTNGIFWANGTAYSSGSGSYGNTQVAAYLVANPQTGTYTNANVAAYLPTYTGNVSVGNLNVSTKTTIAGLTIDHTTGVSRISAGTGSGGTISYVLTESTDYIHGDVKTDSSNPNVINATVSAGWSANTIAAFAGLTTSATGIQIGIAGSFLGAVTALSSVNYFSANATYVLTFVSSVNQGLTSWPVYNIYMTEALPSNDSIELFTGGSKALHVDGTTGTVTVSSATQSTSSTTGAFQVIGGAGIGGNLFVGGNITATGTINFTGNANITNITGTSGDFFGNASGFNALYAGIASGFVATPDTVFQSAGNFNGYIQNNFQNINSGIASTTDWVATANNGSDTVYYVDLGIAGNTYSNTSPYNSLGSSLWPNDAYLYAQGSAGLKGGNLVIGTPVQNTVTRIIAGGSTSANIVATFANTGVTVNKLITTNGVFWANGTAFSSGSSGGGGGAGIVYTAATTPPASGNNKGDQWYNTATDVLYEYTYDGTNNVWVDISSSAFAANAASYTFSLSSALPVYAGAIGASTINASGDITTSGNVTAGGNVNAITANVTTVNATNVNTTNLTLGGITVAIVTSMPSSPTPNTLYLVTG